MGYNGLKFPEGSVFLVTGGAGFIGSNLCETILKLGYKVICLDDLSTGSLDNLSEFNGHSDFTFIEGDIRDYEICVNATQGVDYVLHQAAWGSVPRSIEMPLLYEEINIKGTLNMLESSRVNKIKKFVYASSSSVYGDDHNLPKTEGVEGNVLSPYALTKKVNEEYARLYSSIYGLDTYGMRYFNVFGRRQNPEGAYAAVIPKFISMILKDESPKIHGDGQQSRDFTYIDNVIEANLRACLAPSMYSGEVFNIAYGGRIFLNDLYQTICSLLDKKITPIYGPTRTGDIKHSNADITKARELLGYDPDWSFFDGIEAAIDWYTHTLEI